MTKQLKLDEIKQFSGTEQWHRHWMERQITFTDGVLYVAETAGAFWLIDEIAFAQSCVKHVAAEEFQLWKLTVTNNSAVLACEDGDGKAVYSKAIEFTDFPLSEIRFFLCNNVIMLPGEY